MSNSRRCWIITRSDADPVFILHHLIRNVHKDAVPVRTVALHDLILSEKWQPGSSNYLTSSFSVRTSTTFFDRTGDPTGHSPQMQAPFHVLWDISPLFPCGPGIKVFHNPQDSESAQSRLIHGFIHIIHQKQPSTEGKSYDNGWNNRFVHLSQKPGLNGKSRNSPWLLKFMWNKKLVW